MTKKKKGIVIICNLDTRGEDIIFVKEMIQGRGHNAYLLDFSMEEPPPFEGDIPCSEVARRGGMDIGAVRDLFKTERKKATDNQIKGAVEIVMEMFRNGKVDGIFGVGGGTATNVATSVMRLLPFGMPKVMASPMAAHPKYVGQYVGTKDLTMHHTILDIVKMNPLLKIQITNAVGAICGMVEMSTGIEFKSDKPLIAVTSFGPGEMCVQTAIGLLEERGYMPITCHAQGTGDRAMEEMIGDNLFAGVLDICTGGIMENLFGGNRDPGPNRFQAACEQGIPILIAPCGMDHLSYGGNKVMLAKTKDRAQYAMDELRIQVRTTGDELTQAAKVVAERLNRAKGPFRYLIPLKGWSSMDRIGKALYDPEANQVYLDELKKNLVKKECLLEVDMELYSPEFAKFAVDEFINMFSL